MGSLYASLVLLSATEHGILIQRLQHPSERGLSLEGHRGLSEWVNNGDKKIIWLIGVVDQLTQSP